MSGIATKTAEFCSAVQDLLVNSGHQENNTGSQAPGEVRGPMGGGCNHRFCLSDGVLIKDNHIKAAGGISQAVASAGGNISYRRIEVETEIEQVEEALEVAPILSCWII